MTYSHQYNWIILVAISVAGALIRIYFVARHKGNASLLPAILAIVLLAGLIVSMTPSTQGRENVAASFAQVENIVNARCTSCHSSAPVHPSFPAAPLGVEFDTAAQILSEAERIYQQTVVTRVMPIGNLTAMTDAERQIIEQWYRSIGDNE